MLLGVNQGLTWSTTIVMKIDLVGPPRRGLAMGFNEAAGYFAVAVTALATGCARRAVRTAARAVPARRSPSPHSVSDCPRCSSARPAITPGTRPATTSTRTATRTLTGRQIFTRTSFRDRALSAASQAGLVNNLNDGLAWGLFPILFATSGLDLARIGLLVAIYPAVWGLGQMVTGALSDRWGRKWLITAGMLTQAAGLAIVAASSGFAAWALAAMLMGVGTAMVYPTLLAVVGDVAHPAWRARAVGVYRLWRDAGYAIGALIAGITADLLGVRAAVWIVAALTAISGLVVAARMYETRTITTAEAE